MASPPFPQSSSATSPTYSSYQNPSTISKKRSATDMTSAPHKRRKASMISLSHPLRQTSFPPESLLENGRRSPSVDAMSFVSGSQVSTTEKPKKKRGRKSKKELAENASFGESSSAVAGPTSTVGGGSNAPGKESGKKQQEEEEEQLGPLQMELVDSSAGTKEKKQEENRLRGMLVEAFDPEQYNRYERWRAAKLGESTVRKVVNAAASQSAPPMGILAMKTVTKLFIGDIIESARRIQTEWIHAGVEPLLEIPVISPEDSTADEEKKEPEKVKRRGPLRPEHLREAARRYRVSKEGGTVGMQSPWHTQQQTGVERFSVITGKRIFK
ncbi:Transcription initiation factor TFIID subunit 11 [Ceratocystis lukuohia]|uniref:Transcription initiation factor TFIID subunit 11 n=2 Tax=Ceratocystis TaxID=5157 RepID=A0A2C5X1F2_9PEZI|nr:Transcription initiation factor TFIID subunit 11 [Ceratocystis fimbriata CBS 114723]